MCQTIPLGVRIASGFISLLAVFVGLSLYYAPDLFIKNLDFKFMEVRFLVEMWAARQIAVALGIGYALFRQSVNMLITALVVYAAMNVQDVFIGLYHHDNGLAGGATFFTLLSSGMIFYLYNPNFFKKLIS